MGEATYCAVELLAGLCTSTFGIRLLAVRQMGFDISGSPVEIGFGTLLGALCATSGDVEVIPSPPDGGKAEEAEYALGGHFGLHGYRALISRAKIRFRLANNGAQSRSSVSIIEAVRKEGWDV